MLVPAAEYRPDVAGLNSSFTGDLSNVIPSAGGYLPFKQLAALSQALPSQPFGWLATKALDGSIRFFAGTATNLYVLNSGSLTWTEISKTTNGYHASAVSKWSIKSFGNYVIAVNQADAPQVYQIGTDTKFRNLGGSPPIAGRVAIWGDFVALMEMPSFPNRVQWSGLNNCEFWTPGSQNSDYQEFPDGGRVQGSSETTNPIIFMESAIYRGTFVPGSVEIFTFQKVHDKRGAFSPDSIASRGSTTFYADAGGFFQIEADGSVSPIGFEKVDKTVFSDIMASAASYIQASIDPFYSRVHWSVDFTGSGVFDTIFVYDWQLSAWTVLKTRHTGLMPLITFGRTLESLDSLSASLDALSVSLDSKVWQGGAPVLAAFSEEFKLCTFSGPNLEATIYTPEIGDTTGAVMRTTSTYPVVDCDNVYVSLGLRMRRGLEEFVWLPEQTRSANTGRIRKRSRARFHSLKVRIPAGEPWTRFTGVDIETAEAGSR